MDYKACTLGDKPGYMDGLPKAVLSGRVDLKVWECETLLEKQNPSTDRHRPEGAVDL